MTPVLPLSDEAKGKLHEYQVPEHIHEGIIAWCESARPVGDFLTAVIENDLSLSLAHADRKNKVMLHATVMWFYNWAPCGAALRRGASKSWPRQIETLRNQQEETT